MKRFYKLLFFFTVSSCVVFGQSDQVNNGGFENWNTTQLGDALIGPWISSGFGQIVKSTDAIDQNFSAQLHTVDDDGTVAIGTLLFALQSTTNDFDPVPYTAEIDSFVAYVKYDIQPLDTAVLAVAQYVGAQEIISYVTLTGTTNDWTRISFPLNSNMQEGVVLAFSSSNLFEETGLVGSSLTIDNISFVNTSSTPPSIPNNSFENWQELSFSNPESWTSLNPVLGLFGLTPNVTQDASAQSGSSSARLEVLQIGNDTLPALLVYGLLDAGGGISGTPYTATPTSMKGYYKYQPAGDDQAFINVAFQSGGTLAGGNFLVIDEATTDFTLFDIDVTIFNFPDTVSIIISAGDNPGSVLWVDDIEFDGLVNANEATFISGLSLAPNPASDWLQVSYPASTADMELRLFDFQGRLLQQKTLNASLGSGMERLDVSTYPAGMYMVEISQGKMRVSRKVVIE